MSTDCQYNVLYRDHRYEIHCTYCPAPGFFGKMEWWNHITIIDNNFNPPRRYHYGYKRNISNNTDTWHGIKNWWPTWVKNWFGWEGAANLGVCGGSVGIY